MPIVYYQADSGTAPLIAEEETPQALLAVLKSMPAVPDWATKSETDARGMLSSLPPPNGWYDTADELETVLKQLSKERDARLLSAAMNQITEREGKSVSARDMANRLGLADAQNDGSAVRKILSAKSGMSGPTRRNLARLVRGDPPMSDDEQAQILNSVDDGRWQDVGWQDLRRLKRKGMH